LFGQVWDYFSFYDLWHPEWLGVTIIFGSMYLLAVGPFRHRFREAQPVPFRQKFLFLCGLLILYVTLGSPLYLLGSFLFSVHMFQMALFYFVMPPLILLGTPDWFVRPLLRRQWIKKMVSILTQPLIAILLFNGMLSFYHIPWIFDSIASNNVYDTIFHTILLCTAFFMWWNITCPISEYERLSSLLKIAYIVGNGVLLYPVCALIIFADELVYKTYIGAPQLFSFLTPLNDQQLAGVVMKIVQETVLGTDLAHTFFQWVRKEKRKDALDAVESDTRLIPLTSSGK
jgi:putative membrane protein